LAGFRLHVECGSDTTVTFLNRTIHLTAEKMWHDIGLCDAEILKLHFIKTLNVKI
jgi:hypothetical protein